MLLFHGFVQQLNQKINLVVSFHETNTRLKHDLIIEVVDSLGVSPLLKSNKILWLYKEEIFGVNSLKVT